MVHHYTISPHLDVDMVQLITFFVLAGASMLSFNRADNIEQRISAVLPHSDIPVWQEPIPLDNIQRLAVKFKPQLHVYNGCQPYAVVDANGNTGGGLKPSGSPAGKCSDRSKAQIYSRSGWYNGQYGIMYSWYMAKDEPMPFIGHRHDWEGTVIWLSSNEPNATIVAASTSAHSGYTIQSPINEVYVKDGVSVRIGYESHWPLDHQTDFTTEDGEFQPLIQWEQMTDAARDALETTSFGKADVMINNSNFERKMGKAFYK